MFGLPPVIAQVNVRDGKTFRSSELFTQNIAPFLGTRTGADKFGQVTGSYTLMMADHPLHALMQVLGQADSSPRTNEAAGGRSASVDEAAAPDTRAGGTLLDFLNLRMNTRYAIFRADWLRERLLHQLDWRAIVADAKARFPSDPHYRRFLELVEELHRIQG
jgi:hypothetical protein